jgi:hypothetical protein
LKFHVVGVAEDVLDGAAVDRVDDPGAFTESKPKQGVVYVGLGFVNAGDGVFLGGGTIISPKCAVCEINDVATPNSPADNPSMPRHERDFSELICPFNVIRGFCYGAFSA